MARHGASSRRERLVRSTLKAAWAKFGVEDLDEETSEYMVGVACTVIAEAATARDAELELFQSLGPILRAQDLKDKYVSALCKALGRAVSDTKEEESEQDDDVICRCKDLILMYLGSTQLLLKDTTFELRKGHRYGIVGSNGTGKTTLMERIADGAIAELAHSKLRFVHIRHEALGERTDVSQTALDYAWQVVGPDAPLHSALDEVGFTDELKLKPICELSGGWRVRLLLATAVARSADVLLLDEPTNHLDAQAVSWLVVYLTRKRDSTSVVVSHDASFLDQICTDIIHFDECQLKYYAGNFTFFQKKARQHNTSELLKVRSDDAPLPLPRKKVMPTKPQDGGLRIALPVPGKVEGLTSSKKPILELKDVSFKYLMAKDYSLRHINGKVTASSRIAIVGPNGSGKSTLLSLICGELRPCGDEKGQVGEVHRHRGLRLAYVAQSHAFHLSEYAKCTPEEYIQVRFRNGYDEELQKRLLAAPDQAEAAMLQRLATRFGKYGKQVEAVLSRRKQRNDWRYEVKWQDLAEKQNTFESTAKLRQLGVERLASALDERLAVGAMDSEDRPLTRREIVRHFEGFGLTEELTTQRPISQLSGGQKSKMMLGAAAWNKPHVLCLDEPTNFLDFETVDALGRALRLFRGSVVIVSHNEDFLASICEEVWSVQDQQVLAVKAETHSL